MVAEVQHYKKSLMIPKEAINQRRPYNTMTKTKRIKRHTLVDRKPRLSNVNSGAAEE